MIIMRSANTGSINYVQNQMNNNNNMFPGIMNDNNNNNTNNNSNPEPFMLQVIKLLPSNNNK